MVAVLDGRGWCVDFCKALGGVPAAWAFHIYGAQAANGPLGGGAPAGWSSLKTMLEYLKGDAYTSPGLSFSLPDRGTNLTAPVYITETGENAPKEVSEAQQAIDLKARILDAAELGVEALYIFCALGEYGVFTAPTSSTVQARPAVAALAEAVAAIAA
jgi:hypothetical protein